MGRTDARMSLTLPPELKDEFVALAEKNQRSVTQELVLAIQEHLERSIKTKDDELTEKIVSVINSMKKEGAI